MSETEKTTPESTTPETKPAAAPAEEAQAPKKSAIDTIGGVGTLASAAAGFVASIMGAGWAGIAALVLGGGALAFVIQFAVRWINRTVDERDLRNAGEDAGRTAVDLANQAGKVRQDLDDLERQDPPARPSA